MFLFPGLKRELGPREEISMDSYVMRVTRRMACVAISAAALQLAANLLLTLG